LGERKQGKKDKKKTCARATLGTDKNKKECTVPGIGGSRWGGQTDEETGPSRERDG